MLDINLFRVEKGGNPDLVRESQRRRFADEGVVDEIIRLDEGWRKVQVFLLFRLGVRGSSLLIGSC